jgi:type II secretory pathway component PulK
MKRKYSLGATICRVFAKISTSLAILSHIFARVQSQHLRTTHQHDQSQVKWVAMFNMFGSSKAKATTYPVLDLIEKSLWQDVIKRIEDYPSDASLVFESQGAGGNLAIHEACKQQPPVEVIEALIEANPNSVMTKGQWGYLPIHYS